MLSASSTWRGGAGGAPGATGRGSQCWYQVVCQAQDVTQPWAAERGLRRERGLVWGPRGGGDVQLCPPTLVNRVGAGTRTPRTRRSAECALARGCRGAELPSGRASPPLPDLAGEAETRPEALTVPQLALDGAGDPAARGSRRQQRPRPFWSRCQRGEGSLRSTRTRGPARGHPRLQGTREAAGRRCPEAVAWRSPAWLGSPAAAWPLRQGVGTSSRASRPGPRGRLRSRGSAARAWAWCCQGGLLPPRGCSAASPLRASRQPPPAGATAAPLGTVRGDSKARATRQRARGRRELRWGRQGPRVPPRSPHCRGEGSSPSRAAVPGARARARHTCRGRAEAGHRGAAACVARAGVSAAPRRDARDSVRTRGARASPEPCAPPGRPRPRSWLQPAPGLSPSPLDRVYLFIR